MMQIYRVTSNLFDDVYFDTLEKFKDWFMNNYPDYYKTMRKLERQVFNGGPGTKLSKADMWNWDLHKHFIATRGESYVEFDVKGWPESYIDFMKVEVL